MRASDNLMRDDRYPYRISTTFFGPDFAWRDDTSVMHEIALHLGPRLGEFTDANVASQFVDLVLEVCEQMCRVPIV